MKLFLKSIVILVIFFGGKYAFATCQLAKKNNTVSCEEYIDEVCCIVDQPAYNETCYETWCYARDECAWVKDPITVCVES